MWRYNYNEDWERKKSYLIRSLFHDVPLLSPVPEESDDSSDAPPRPPSPIAYRPYSPLPPLIIEREPYRHDEPEEYYRVLEVKIKRIYKKLFIEGRELSDIDFIDYSDVTHDNDYTNVNNDLVGDSNHVTRNGYSADYESYESDVPSYHVEHDNNNDSSNDYHVERNDSRNDISSADVTDENNNSKPLYNESDTEIYEDNGEMGKETINTNDQEELEEEVVDSENTKSGSDYRQITTQAQIHVDGTQVDIQSNIYDGSVRSVILTSRRLGRMEMGQGEDSERGDGEESAESIAEEDSVTLEDNGDPGDVEMTYNESVPEDTDAEESHVISDIEVMRTPQLKISVDSVAHMPLRLSDVTDEYNVTHHAILMTSDCDDSNPTSVLNVSSLNQDEYSGTVDRGRTEVLSHVSPILNVKSSKNINIHRDEKKTEEEIISDMDITMPVSNSNEIYWNEDINGENVDTDRNMHSEEITTDNQFITHESYLNVLSLNEEGDKRGRKRKPEEIISNADEVRTHTPILNEDVNIDVTRDKERTPGTSNLTEPFLNEDGGRKRRGEDVGIQAVAGRVGWEDLKTNLFVGAPKIFRLCSCSEHECNISKT